MRIIIAAETDNKKNFFKKILKSRNIPFRDYRKKEDTSDEITVYWDKVDSVENCINEYYNYFDEKNIFIAAVLSDSNDTEKIKNLNQSDLNEIFFENSDDAETELRFGLFLKIISEYKKNTDEKIMFKNEIERTNSVSSVIVHDLRTPLTAIKMANETMLTCSDVIDTDTKLMLMSTIDNECDNMMNLINNLLDLYKLKSGRFDIIKNRFNLSDALIKTYSSMNRIAQKKNITIDFDVHDEIMIHGDETKLQQVMFNIVNNAVKFTNLNGKIKIKSSKVKDDVIISVHDNGVGVPENEIPLMFKEFTQVSSKATSGEKGTGLGLTISKKIVEAHDGELYAESVLGKGTTFFIKLKMSF